MRDMADKLRADRNDQPLLFLARSLDFGGAERQLVLLSGRLYSAGHHVRLAVFYSAGGLERELHTTGLPLHDLAKKGRWDLLPFLRRLMGFVREEKPTIIHGYLTVPNILAVLLKLVVPGVKVVLGVRASDIDLDHYDRLSRIAFRLECWLSRWADLIIVNSWAGRDYHIDKGFPAEKLKVIPNGIDTQRFCPDQEARQCSRLAWGLTDSDVLIGLIARFDPMKDHPGFLRAAAALARTYPNVRFLCMGGGDPAYRESMKHLAQELGLDARMLWLHPSNDMPKIYPALDILTSSSCFGEGFSNVIGEAMASGVPCVVTDVGDSARIVGDVGRTIPPRDTDALVNAWRELLELSDAEKATLGVKARQRIDSHFSVDSLVTATVAALESLT